MRHVSEQRNDRPAPSEYVHPDDVHRGRRPQFSPFMDPRLIEKGLQDGSLVKGELRINKRLRADAYVTSEALEHDIFINGSRNRNRALDGDIVAVRLLDADKAWESKKERMRRRKVERESVPADMEIENLEDEDDEEEDEDKDKPKYAGEVVGIIERSNHCFAGILLLERPQSGGNKANGDADKENAAPVESMESKLSQQRLAWFKPTDKRTPLIAIVAHHAPPELVAEDGKQTSIVSARITRWPIDALFPFGKIVRSLGPTGSIAAETVATLTDCDIIDASFPDQALKALPPTPWEIPAAEYKKRRDLRDTCIFTIDPSTAKDLDDAVHITPLGDGNFEVGVHIADVSYFVKRNTPLDTEARRRGTSTYLVERVIPMLPSLLCEQLCSLNPGVERLAFSVIWKMDSEGNVLDTWFGRSIIKSCAKLAYDDAQNVIEGKGLPEPVAIMDYPRKEVEDAITHLYKLSKCMRKRRFDGGALSINSVRLSIKLDDQGEPESVSIYQLKDANRLIEEFMLCANMSVAEKICTHYPQDAMLRRHSPPIERRLEEFLKQAEDLGFGMDGSTAGALQQSFSSIESEDVKQVLMVLAIKPMQRAKYFCTGALSEDKYMHYALNVPLYTHFTSPIRRYADIMVHRQLDSAIRNLGSHGYNTKSVARIAAECNRNRDNAKNAQDMNIQLYLAHYLAKLEQKEGRVIRQAVVVQVLKDAFDMLIPEYGIEKRIFSEDLPLVKRRFDPNDMALSLYWKKGVTPTADGHDVHDDDEEEDDDDDDKMDHKRKKSARRSSGGLYVEDEDLDEPDASRPVLRPEDIQNAPDEELDAATCMQKFKVFTKFDAVIQVNMEKSPPIINVYPVNPFQ
ncbi:hypothetical protein BCR43DRAFT_443784 [Syncephalastrum racemosum]|uniref:DIS3-like exonuclease 2 n=1 Tax=Syncephalastrum racemosum TaxID=13706 RepID=A0A1X2H6H9_SYNRA|nr:hypothetical protein BCR43DRAFT_443784 [Syncephalastrum racemosum]